MEEETELSPLSSYHSFRLYKSHSLHLISWVEECESVFPRKVWQQNTHNAFLTCEPPCHLLMSRTHTIQGKRASFVMIRDFLERHRWRYSRPSEPAVRISPRSLWSVSVSQNSAWLATSTLVFWNSSVGGKIRFPCQISAVSMSTVPASHLNGNADIHTTNETSPFSLTKRYHINYKWCNYL